MPWEKTKPSSAFFTYPFTNPNEFNAAMRARTPIEYPTLTDNNLKIIDVVVIGIDWSFINPIVMSVPPQTMMSVCGSTLSTWNDAGRSKVPGWRPEKNINETDPVNGFPLNQSKITALNGRLQTGYFCRANGIGAYSHPASTMFSTLEQRVTGVADSSTEQLSDYYILYYMQSITNYLSRFGYRVPNVSNPNAPNNWITLDIDNTSTNAFARVMYLTYDDWLVNMVPREPNSIKFSPSFIHASAPLSTHGQFNLSVYNQVGHTNINGQLLNTNSLPADQALHAGQSLVANDFKFKLHMDYSGECYLYPLPFTATSEDAIIAARVSCGFTTGRSIDIDRGAVIPVCLVMQSDGHLVLYANNATNTARSRALWAHQRYNQWYNKDGKSTLILEAGGVLIHYNSSNATRDPNVSVVLNSEYEDLNMVQATSRFDDQCNHYWKRMGNAPDGSYGPDVVDVDFQGKCYSNPRVQYGWRNGQVAKMNTKYQMINWVGIKPITSLDQYYNIREYKDILSDVSSDKKLGTVLSYCMTGKNWATDSMCRTLARTPPAADAAKTMITMDIEGRMCSNTANDGAVVQFCEYLNPTTTWLADLIKKIPDLKQINHKISSRSDLSVYRNGDVKETPSERTNVILANISKNLTVNELYELWALMVDPTTGWYVTPIAPWFDKFKSVTNTDSNLPIVKLPDYNLTAPMRDNGVAPFVIIYNHQVIGHQTFPVYYDVIARANTYAPNKKIPVDSRFWYELVVNSNNLIPLIDPRKLTNADRDSSEIQKRFTNNNTQYQMMFGKNPCYDIIEYYCSSGTTDIKFYIAKLKTFKDFFFALQTITGTPVNPKQLMCVSNPDWCIDQSLAYINDSDNYNTSLYKKICDDMTFNAENKDKITKACLDSMAINNCAVGTKRYDSSQLVATGSRPLIQYQAMWQSLGCKSDLANISVGMSSNNTDKTVKDAWNDAKLGAVQANMAFYANNASAETKKLCIQPFTSKEGFSSGSCVDVCNQTNLPANIKAACDKGTIEYCKINDNIFNPTCIAAKTKIPSLVDVEKAYCKGNTKDIRCPEGKAAADAKAKAEKDAADRQQIMMIIVGIIIVVLVASGIGYFLYKRRAATQAQQMAAPDMGPEMGPDMGPDMGPEMGPNSPADVLDMTPNVPMNAM